MKNVLFDIVTPKWVLFFKPIIEKLQRDHNVRITTRGDDSYGEVVELLDLHGLNNIRIGRYGGEILEGKLKTSIHRTKKLIDIVKNVDVVVSGSVVDVNRVAFGLGKKVVNFNDMPIKDYDTACNKITAVTRLTAPLSTTLYKPFMVPDEIFEKLGVCDIREYNFIDPVIWLKNFKPDIEYVKQEIPQLDFKKRIIVIREEEYKASYVNERYGFLDEAVKELEKENVNIIIIPRYESDHLKHIFKQSIILEKKIVLQHLLAYTDLFIGGGGTINIEATYFGVPVISTRSFISHYDKFLIDNGLMWHSNDVQEIVELAKKLINKKTTPSVYQKMHVDLEYLIDGIID